MTKPIARSGEALSFGPFSLATKERLLTRNGVPVDLSGRALDLLIALTSRPNEIVSKKDLLAMVWPDIIVEEGSLRYHIVGLRRALGDGKDGARFIVTVPGRGYCFAAPVSGPGNLGHALERGDTDRPLSNLPPRLLRMVGRADDLDALKKQMEAGRFVTIVGPGGIGKTTVAVAAGHDLIDAFASSVIFVDLGALGDPGLVPATLAAILGLSVQSDDVIPGLIAHLQRRRLLLILDTCEHLIEAVAALTARIVAAAPAIHILATSREALRVEGEHVFKLAPLACPPDGPSLTTAFAQTFPAFELFVERAAARGARLSLSDEDAVVVAEICRKLDGLALAIELAAGRVEAYGLQQIATLLDQHLTPPWPGHRTAPPRQRTVQATLDWSYGLLTGLERVVLRQLAVFIGYFTFEAALEVVASTSVERSRVFAAIDSLVAKSMVAVRPIGAMVRYRLLDTTRIYVLERDVDDAEIEGLAARHASYYRRWLEQTGTEWPTLSNAADRAPHLAGLGNVRAALDWCFGAGGNTRIGVGLAASAAPVFLAMSLLTECQRWSERALLALDDFSRGGPSEMFLQAAFGMSLMFLRGQHETARVALDRSLEIAEERRDAANQLQLLGPVHMFHLRRGDYRGALQQAERSSAVARTMEDPAAIRLTHSLLGIALHLAGDLDRARTELEAALQHAPAARRTRSLYLGFDHQNWASIALARTLWLQGHPAQAVERARRSVEDAARMDHPVTLSIALNWAISVFFWTGDLESAEEHVERFIAHAQTHSLGPYLAVGRGFKGELAIRQGDAEAGVESVRSCLADLHAARYELLTTAFHIALIHGLVATGRIAEGMALIDESIHRVESGGDFAYMPELLRLKGSILSMTQGSAEDAMTCFAQSLDLSRRQGSLAWQLRTSIDLAALWMTQDQTERARALLEPVRRQFPDDFGTTDTRAADRLMAILGSSTSTGQRRG